MIDKIEIDEEEALLPERPITDDLEMLLAALPLHIRQSLENLGDRAALLEIVMDLGRLPEARYRDREVYLGDREVTEAELEHVIQNIGTFGSDNRAGIERTLHRISVIRNRAGKAVGLTCRVGRAVFGTIGIIQDLVESGQSILLVGRPGVGKTTLLRETARVLADDLHKRVIIVDTSNEIAGDGDIPHPAIGRARRMQVARPDLQHNVMIEAVENHMPEVIVIDEIGTQLEAEAARTINERGVQLIGTAHGVSLENLMLNPTLSDLIGGIQSVTLGDEEARRRGTQKSVLERKAPPTFDTMVEIRDRDRVAVHLSVADTVDAILRGQPYTTQIRYRNEKGEIETYEEEIDPEAVAVGNAGQQPTGELSMAAFGFGPQANSYGNNSRSRGHGSGVHGAATVSAGGYTGRKASNNRGTNGTVALERGGGAVASRPQATLPEEPIALPTQRQSRDKQPHMPSSQLKPLRIYPHGVNKGRLENVVKQMGVPADIVRDMSDSDLVLTLKNYYRQKPLSLRQAENEGIPIYILKSNTAAQIEGIIAQVFGVDAPTRHVDEDEDRIEGEMDVNSDPVKSAIYQTEDAINQVMQKGQPVELPPQNSFIRRLQHQMAERYNLLSQSRGREPYRRVKIYPQ
ncbi:MAG TPA: R3H domain-containing nucleic acid-binding protein [Chloroflexia bacterium]|nr:R3H domain-containing nucleic acid-binding protein [Chloroflexia bacterium]